MPFLCVWLEFYLISVKIWVSSSEFSESNSSICRINVFFVLEKHLILKFSSFRYKWIWSKWLKEEIHLSDFFKWLKVDFWSKAVIQVIKRGNSFNWFLQVIKSGDLNIQRQTLFCLVESWTMQNQLILLYYSGFNHFLVFPLRCLVSIVGYLNSYEKCISLTILPYLIFKLFKEGYSKFNYSKIFLKSRIYLKEIIFRDNWFTT